MKWIIFLARDVGGLTLWAGLRPGVDGLFCFGSAPVAVTERGTSWNTSLSQSLPSQIFLSFLLLCSELDFPLFSI